MQPTYKDFALLSKKRKENVSVSLNENLKQYQTNHSLRDCLCLTYDFVTTPSLYRYLNLTPLLIAHKKSIFPASYNTVIGIKTTSRIWRKLQQQLKVTFSFFYKLPSYIYLHSFHNLLFTPNKHTLFLCY